MPPFKSIAAIQKRTRPIVLLEGIAASEVDASGLAVPETSDMTDAADVTARRTMADEQHDDEHWQRHFVSFTKRVDDNMLLDELDQPLATVERQSLMRCANLRLQDAAVDVPLMLCHMLMSDHLAHIEERLRALTKTYTSLMKDLGEQEERRMAEILRSMDLVGMTSTGAALNMNVLANLKPSIIIVEEAAELLEPQLLAVLHRSVKHLIMIGDHEQLRPQVSHYDLVRHKKFDVSMFERLATTRCSPARCDMQSRMREMVGLVRSVSSPHVKSHERVSGADHDVPACLQHSMFFWTHQHPEAAARSVLNEAEAQMIMRLIGWLIKEGESPRRSL